MWHFPLVDCLCAVKECSLWVFSYVGDVYLITNILSCFICSYYWVEYFVTIILDRFSSLKGNGLPQQAEVAQGVPGRLRHRIFLTFRHYKGGRSSAKSTDHFYPRRNPWYSLSEAESTSGHMVLSGGATEKIPSDTTGNRSRDRPTSSAVP